MESSTARMKQAEDWGRAPGTPMLNHTGELNDTFWVTSRCVSSSVNPADSSASAK